MGKIVYQYDRTGMYQGETVADESPREPGVYLVPDRCTVIAPPVDFPDDKWPRWNGASWDLVSKPVPPAPEDPVAKLTEFLVNNPDVAALLKEQAPAL